MSGLWIKTPIYNFRHHLALIHNLLADVNPTFFTAEKKK